MLPKKNRADKKSIEKIFKEGLFLRSSDLTFKYLKDKSNNQPKISIIVPKALFKSAVKRNSLRRAGYAILKKYTSLISPQIVGAFVLGKKSLDNLESEIKNILNKIH
jgi:ribonuclease P protein component